MITRETENTVIDWDEQNAQLAQVISSGEIYERFRNFDQEIEAETESLRKRTFIDNDNAHDRSIFAEMEDEGKRVYADELSPG